MNDDKIQGQNNPVQNQQQPPIQNQPSQSAGVGTLAREREMVQSQQVNTPEYIEPSGSEKEPQVHQELAEMGVKSVSETPQLDNYAQKAGVSHANESVPVLTQKDQLIKLHQELKNEGIDRLGINNSGPWLFKTVKKALKKLNVNV